MGTAHRWREEIDIAGCATDSNAPELHVLVEQDGIAIGVDGDKAGGSGGGLVGFLLERNTLGFQLALEVADVGEGVEFFGRFGPSRD